MEQFVPIHPWGSIDQPVVNVGRNGLRFNAKNFDVLHQVSYIQVLLDHNAGKFALRASKESDTDSIPFYPSKGSTVTQFKINSRPFVRQLRRIAGWSAGETWNIIGSYSAKDNAIIYDLHAAFKPSSRSGWSSGQRCRHTKNN